MRAIVLALLIALIVLLSEQAEAAERDKILHFAGSAAISAITYAITDDAKIAIAVGLGAGLAKELYDSRKGGTGFDKRDLAADALGVATGLGLAVTFEF
jgi:putative lipoprotein